jgi:hypothetical protein
MKIFKGEKKENSILDRCWKVGRGLRLSCLQKLKKIYKNIPIINNLIGNLQICFKL